MMSSPAHQNAADSYAVALTAHMRQRGFSNDEIWMALMSIAAAIGRTEVGPDILAKRLLALAPEVTVKAMDTHPTADSHPPPPTLWRTMVLGGGSDEE